MNIKASSLDFKIPAQNGDIRIIGNITDQIVTDHFVESPKVEDGFAVSDVERDILKIVVIERHRATGNIGKGFIRGFGLKRGAIAGTVAHDHHNLIVIGVDDESMHTAVETLINLGGGLVAVDGQEVLATLPLPVAGLMSEESITVIRADYDALTAAARELGSTTPDPFMAMSFMGLEVIPKLKLTDMGLVDVGEFAMTELFVP